MKKPTQSPPPPCLASMASRYQGRIAVLATKHGKARALAWPLSRSLGLALHVPAGLDTGLLGTFTGEITRIGSPAEVVRRKARLGMAATGRALGMASEGSFGPHPLLGLIPSAFEVLVWVDDEEALAQRSYSLPERRAAPAQHCPCCNP